MGTFFIAILCLGFVVSMVIQPASLSCKCCQYRSLEDLFARAADCLDFICTHATPSNAFHFHSFFCLVMSKFYDGEFSGLSYCACLFSQGGSHGYILLLFGSGPE